MITLQAKKHDSFSVELKFGFVSDGTEKINDFAVNTWLFLLQERPQGQHQPPAQLQGPGRD